jgi:hypothetical protein
VAEWKSDSTFLCNSTPHCLHECICFTRVCLVEFLQRELALHSTACPLANTSTHVNITVMSLCILPNKTCILESLGENVGLHSVIIPKRFLKIRLSFPTHTRYTTFLSSSSSVVLTRLSGPHSIPTTFFFVVLGIEPRPPDL